MYIKAIHLEFGKAFCASGAIPCSSTNGQTVRYPCSFCQSMFQYSGACGGILSNRTYSEIAYILDNTSDDVFKKIQTAHASVVHGGKSDLTPTIIRHAIKYGFKIAYSGCNATVCSSCGNSFYVFNSKISRAPELGQKSITKCSQSLPSLIKSNADYTCGSVPFNVTMPTIAPTTTPPPPDNGKWPHSSIYNCRCTNPNGDIKYGCDGIGGCSDKGICTENTNGAHCECVWGYSGYKCQIKPKKITIKNANKCYYNITLKTVKDCKNDLTIPVNDLTKLCTNFKCIGNTDTCSPYCKGGCVEKEQFCNPTEIVNKNDKEEGTASGGFKRFIGGTMMYYFFENILVSIFISGVIVRLSM